MEVLAGLLICGVALIPLAAFVLLLNVWQRVQRLEEAVRAMGGQVQAGQVGVAGPASAPPGPSASTAPAPAAIPAAKPAAIASTAAAAGGASVAAAPASTVAPSASSSPMPPAATPASPPAVQRPERRSVERALGARLPIWIGSIAVALAGVFLFKYAIDEGYFGPLARVVVGVIAGLVMLGAAEWLRRRSRSVAGGLAAAGIAVLYASIVAATNLYGLIGPLAGGLAMAAITAAAVALSLRFGPVVVVIGLVGGFLTPALIGDVEPNPWRLFGYLALLQLGVLTVARRRAWWWLGPVVLFGGGVWSMLWLLGDAYDPADGLPIGLFVLLGAAAVIVSAGGDGKGEASQPDERAADGAAAGEAGVAAAAVGGGVLPAGHATPAAEGAAPAAAGRAAALRFDPSIAAGWLGVAYAAVLLGLTVTAGSYRLFDWLFYAILGAGALALGRLNAAWDRVPWLTAAMTAGLLVNAAEAASGGVNAPAWWLAPAFGVLYAVGAYGLMHRAERPDRWAFLSAASTVVYYLVARNALWPDEPTDRWGLIAVGLAAALAAAAAPMARRRLAAVGVGGAVDGGERLAPAPGGAEARALSALGIGVTAMLFLGAAIELEHWWLAAAMAFIAAGACWAARWLALPALAQTAWPLAGLATVRLLAIPEDSGFPTGSVPVFNPILLGYAAPIAGFLAAAEGASFMRGGPPTAGAGSGRAEGRLTEALRWMGLVLATAMVHLLISNAFHRAEGVGIWDPGDGPLAVAEWSAHVLALLGLALGARTLARRRPWRALALGGTILAWAALAVGAFIALLAANPLLRPLPVGSTPVVNALLLLYGAPAVACLVLARRQIADGDRTWLPLAAAAVAGVLGFVLLSLEVRQAFHGTDLTIGDTTVLEKYSYSVAWLVYGLALLAVGIARRLPAARYASLAVMIVTVCKVFLVDTAGLTGLYRVASFLGLGLSLLGLAFVYQRFVFRTAPDEAA